MLDYLTCDLESNKKRNVKWVWERKIWKEIWDTDWRLESILKYYSSLLATTYLNQMDTDNCNIDLCERPQWDPSAPPTFNLITLFDPTNNRKALRKYLWEQDVPFHRVDGFTLYLLATLSNRFHWRGRIDAWAYCAGASLRDCNMCIRESIHLCETRLLPLQVMHRVQGKNSQIFHGVREEDGRGWRS